MNDDVIFFFASKGPYQIYDEHCKGILATVVIGSQHAPVLNFINSSYLVWLGGNDQSDTDLSRDEEMIVW